MDYADERQAAAPSLWGRRARFSVLCVTCACLIAVVAPSFASAQRTTEPTAATAQTTSAPVTDAWDAVLKAHVKEGRVDYRALKRDGQAMEKLARFVGSLERMSADAPLSEWLNAYNALVVHAVLERYPLESVMGVPNFFKAKRFHVAGRERSLDDIEHKVIRPRFKDARVHVALNCGAVSCPTLHGRAFRGPTLDETLDRLARAMVQDERHVQLRPDGWHVSALFQWFAEDFVRDAGSVRAWIARYRGDEEEEPGAALHYLPYDWRLNDRPR